MKAAERIATISEAVFGSPVVHFSYANQGAGGVAFPRYFQTAPGTLISHRHPIEVLARAQKKVVGMAL